MIFFASGKVLILEKKAALENAVDKVEFLLRVIRGAFVLRKQRCGALIRNRGDDTVRPNNP